MPDAGMIAWAVAFAAQVTGLPQSSALPVIEQISIVEMQRRGQLGWWAFTNWADQKVTLRADWQADVAGRCLLVHELTHWLQMTSKLRQEGSQQLEPEAYFAQQQCYLQAGDAAGATWAGNRVVWCQSHRC